MIQEQLAHLPESLPDYRPFPPAKERTAWQGLPLRVKQRFLQAGEAALQTPHPPPPPPRHRPRGRHCPSAERFR